MRRGTHYCISVHTHLSKSMPWSYCLFYCLTVLSHQSVGHIRDSLHEIPQKGEGGQEMFYAGLVIQLDRKQVKKIY